MADWQSVALAQGKDVNSPEFAAQRAADAARSNNGASGGNASNYIQSATDQIRKNMQPGIDQLNTGITNTGAAYDKYRTTQQGNIAPLQERYKAILDSIKGNQTAAENKQTAVTSAELGRRGITTDSGVGATEVNNALQPITAQYSLQGANVGLQEQQDINGINSGIANSFIGENTDTNGIRSALASLYGNAATSGASTGASLYGTDTQAELQRKAQEQQAQQAAIQQALAQSQQNYTQMSGDRNYNEGVREFNVQQAKTAANQAYNPLATYGGSTTQTQPKATGKTVIGKLADGRYLWSDGSAGWSGGK